MEEPIKSLTIDEYLRLEESSQTKHEFLDGELYAMTGGTMAHSLIATNIGTMLKSQLKSSGCRVYISDLKVRVNATNSFYYPDVLVECGTYKGDSLYTDAPLLVFEVLSKSTASTDRREKLFAYKRIESLRAYVIVQQSRRRVTIYLRDERDTNDWTRLELSQSQGTLLQICAGTAVQISLDEIYEDCQLDDVSNLQVREDAAEYAW